MTNFAMPLTAVSPVQTSTMTATLTPCRSATAIRAKAVEMRFQSKVEDFMALRGVDLSVCRGDVQLLMGPSGSGKTTLLSILAGILTPTGGSVSLLGHDITRMSQEDLSVFRRDHVGFVFQGFNLFPALTAAENIEVALKLKGTRKRDRRTEALDLLEQVGLAEKAHLLPKDLSGGQKQRVAIARSLAGSPELIMADEPTAALDSHNGQAVIQLLCRLAKEHEATVLVVTHDPRIVEYADRIAHLEDGMIQHQIKQQARAA